MTEELGAGIIIGLIYGIGLYIAGRLNDSNYYWLFLIPCFIAFLVHIIYIRRYK